MEVMIEPLLASKNLCNLADVLKYLPSASNLARSYAMLKQHSSFHVAVWAESDTLFRGRSHNSLAKAKKASCSELAPAHLKK